MKQKAELDIACDALVSAQVKFAEEFLGSKGRYGIQCIEDWLITRESELKAEEDKMMMIEQEVACCLAEMNVSADNVLLGALRVGGPTANLAAAEYVADMDLDVIVYADPGSHVATLWRRLACSLPCKTFALHQTTL